MQTLAPLEQIHLAEEVHHAVKKSFVHLIVSNIMNSFTFGVVSIYEAVLKLST